MSDLLECLSEAKKEHERLINTEYDYDSYIFINERVVVQLCELETKDRNKWFLKNYTLNMCIKVLEYDFFKDFIYHEETIKKGLQFERLIKKVNLSDYKFIKGDIIKSIQPYNEVYERYFYFNNENKNTQLCEVYTLKPYTRMICKVRNNYTILYEFDPVIHYSKPCYIHRNEILSVYNLKGEPNKKNTFNIVYNS